MAATELEEADPADAAAVPPLLQARISVLDDDPAMARMVKRALENAGYDRVRCWSHPLEALEGFRSDPPDLVILDLRMPGMDGTEVLDQLDLNRGEAGSFPVVVLTSDTTREAKEEVFSRGASDFVAKPVSPAELRYRVRNLLETRRLRKLLERHNQRLEERVRRRTAELEEARVEILERLAVAAEYRDDDTGAHTRRVGVLSREIGRRLSLGPDELEALRRAAPLHDVGKIGIADEILLKPGPLTEDEFATMKKHTLIGEGILSGSRFPVLRMAASIARSHHEDWNGAGYPDGLTGEEIPLPARIVAVADVYDSLTHERVYKDAMQPDDALEEIRAGAGEKFDPHVLEAFFEVMEDTDLDELDDVHGT